MRRNFYHEQSYTVELGYIEDVCIEYKSFRRETQGIWHVLLKGSEIEINTTREKTFTRCILNHKNKISSEVSLRLSNPTTEKDIRLLHLNTGNGE